MESTPEPRPNEWEKRRITPLSLQTQGVCYWKPLLACIASKEKMPVLFQY